MNLHGSIADLQKASIQLYLKLQKRFKDNVLIRELWESMAGDVSQQKDSLKALPPSFWNQLQKEHGELVQAAIPYARLQVIDDIKDIPLKSCIEGALQFEEPTILKIYIPIIRSLREDPANPALDFYIMVKAHLARIARMTASFSGDPVIIQRSSLLLQSFEREIQEPPAEAIVPQAKSRATRHSAKRRATAESRRKPAAKPRKPAANRAKPAKKTAKSSKAPKRAGTLAKRAKTRHHRAKPLAKKVNLQRTRARARR